MTSAHASPIRPLGRRVVVARDPILETYGSLVIPESARQKPQTGRVLAVGPEVTTVAVGDLVLFGRYATVDVPIGQGKDMTTWAFLNEQDLMGVLDAG